MRGRRSPRDSLGKRDPWAPNAKTPRARKVAALVSPSGRATEVATLTVIGTLRPTERRRAMSFTLANVAPTKKVSENQRSKQDRPNNVAERDRTPDLCTAIGALS